MDIKDFKSSTNKLKVIYIEDNRDVSSVNMELFSDIFFSVDLAEDGLKALELYKSNEYDLVITDINLPKMSGVEVIRNILKIDEEQLIIIISAYDEHECLELLQEMNIKHILKKPVKSKKLLHSICSCIDGLACA